MESVERVTQVWSTGSNAEHARNYLSMAAGLVEESGVDADDQVLDVACGTGIVAVTAARRGAQVTGLDITPAMLEDARANADLAGVEDVRWREGDATDLPFEENAFDATLSNLGHIFGDPPEATARELARVTRPGGRIAFTAWTPTSCFPAMAGVLSSFLEPEELPDFSEPPFVWGDEGVVRDRMDGRLEDPAFETRTLEHPALSPAHFWHEMATTSGMFAELLEADRPALCDRMVETVRQRFDDARNAVRLEYLRSEATVT
jgi:SAM-dependent methyltransferase